MVSLSHFVFQICPYRSRDYPERSLDFVTSGTRMSRPREGKRNAIYYINIILDVGWVRTNGELRQLRSIFSHLHNCSNLDIFESPARTVSRLATPRRDFPHADLWACEKRFTPRRPTPKVICQNLLGTSPRLISLLLRRDATALRKGPSRLLDFYPLLGPAKSTYTWPSCDVGHAW